MPTKIVSFEVPYLPYTPNLLAPLVHEADVVYETSPVLVLSHGGWGYWNLRSLPSR